MSSFNGLLQAEFTPPKTWELSRNLSFKTEDLSDDEIRLLGKAGIECSDLGEIVVSEGFKTDLASVPRMLWAFISPWDIARAAVIHDFLYFQCREYSTKTAFDSFLWKNVRRISDKIFLMAMDAAEPSVPSWKKKSAYYAVRAFGGKAAKGGVILPNDELNC